MYNLCCTSRNSALCWAAEKWVVSFPNDFLVACYVNPVWNLWNFQLFLSVDAAANAYFQVVSPQNGYKAGWVLHNKFPAYHRNRELVP